MIRLVVATGNYAHTRTLTKSGGSGDGFDIEWSPDRPETIFARALSEEAPYDVAEISLATTWALAAAEDSRFLAVPVFPSRMFRLSAFYVRAGIDRPEQLTGGRIGVVRDGQTAAVWGRALLEAQYGIDVSKMQCQVAERQRFEPDSLELNQAGSVADLERMLAEDRLDFLFSTSVPEVFRRGELKRLFPDWPRDEQALCEQFRWLPIMHTVLVRRPLIEASPQLSAALVELFVAARRTALEWLHDTDASVLPLPLHHGWVEAQTQGGTFDPFENGLQRNRSILDAFALHMHQQGLTPRRISPEENVR